MEATLDGNQTIARELTTMAGLGVFGMDGVRRHFRNIGWMELKQTVCPRRLLQPPQKCEWEKTHSLAWGPDSACECQRLRYPLWDHTTMWKTTNGGTVISSHAYTFDSKKLAEAHARWVEGDGLHLQVQEFSPYYPGRTIHVTLSNVPVMLNYRALIRGAS